MQKHPFILLVTKKIISVSSNENDKLNPTSPTSYGDTQLDQLPKIQNFHLPQQLEWKYYRPHQKTRDTKNGRVSWYLLVGAPVPLRISSTRSN